MSSKKYSSRLYPQSIYRKHHSDEALLKKEFRELDISVPKLPSTAQKTVDQVMSLVHDLCEKVLLAMFPENESKNYEALMKEMASLLSVSAYTIQTDLKPLKTVLNFWESAYQGVLNNIKHTILETYTNKILLNFATKINAIVLQYSRHLPRHVAASEANDLTTIAQLEFLETFKVWDPEKSDAIWPLAYSRITGAMKDHVRYITKSDPTRFYDWVTDAAHLYLDMKKGDSFEQKIETGVQLGAAMEVLTVRERQIVVAHTRKDHTFQMIADDMDLSESQISRIYKKAIEKIKKVVDEE